MLLLFSCLVVLESLWPPWTEKRQNSLSLTSHKFYTSLHSLYQWCHPAISSSDAFFSFCPQSFPASGTFPMSHLYASDDQNTGFSASASFSFGPSKEYSGLISLRIDWLGLLAVQGTLRHLPQHHSSKASILQCSVFFMVQLLQLYMITGKTIALNIWPYQQSNVCLSTLCLGLS